MIKTSKRTEVRRVFERRQLLASRAASSSCRQLACVDQIFEDCCCQLAQDIDRAMPSISVTSGPEARSPVTDLDFAPFNPNLLLISVDL